MPANQTFQLGDTVQLKSGGPKMTVLSVHPRGPIHDGESVTAGWFAGAKHERAQFRVEALMVPPPDKSKDK